MLGLTSALESGADTPKVVHELQLDRAKQHLKEAALIAERRSGARGAKARQELISNENAVEAAEQRYGQSGCFDRR